MSDLPSISFLRGSDIAQYGLLRPHNGSLCCLWRRHPAWIGHHRWDAKGGPITVRSHRCYTFMALTPGRKGLHLATQASPWAHCELFHHPSVGIPADRTSAIQPAHEPQLVGPKVLVSPRIPAPQSFPRSRPPHGPQEAPVTRHVSL